MSPNYDFLTDKDVTHWGHKIFTTKGGYVIEEVCQQFTQKEIDTMIGIWEDAKRGTVDTNLLAMIDTLIGYIKAQPINNNKVITSNYLWNV